MQSYTDFKVFVRNDGSGIEFEDMYDQVVRSAPITVHYTSGLNKGISGSTNELLSVQDSELFILTDDDITFDKNFIANHVKHHKSYPGTIMYGPVKLNPENVKTDQDRYKQYMEQKWQQRIGRNEQFAVKVNHENLTITAANLSFSKLILDRVGCFDEALRDAQDYDFGLRALWENIEVWYNPECICYHNESFSISAYANRQKRYSKFNNKLLEKYGKSNKDLRIRPVPRPSGIKILVYNLLRKNTIQHLISNSRIFLWLPRALRYRIYGVSIAALSFEQ